MRFPMRRALHAAVSITLAFALTACGGDDDPPAAPAPSPGEPTPGTPAPPAPTLRCAP